MSLNATNSLSHTKWICKYHTVFASKYRRKVFYKEKRAAIGKILRQLYERKEVKNTGSGKLPCTTLIWQGKMKAELQKYMKNQLKQDEMGENPQ